MDTELYFKTNFPDLVYIKTCRYPQYEIVDFKKWIVNLFPNNILDRVEIGLFRFTIKTKYNNTLDFDKVIIQSFNFDKLYYYQDDIGITGPKHSDIDTPVNIILHNNKYILYNGYHRASVKIIAGEKSIAGRLLVL